MYTMVCIKSGAHDYNSCLTGEPQANRLKEACFFRCEAYRLVDVSELTPAQRLELEPQAVAAVIAEGWVYTRNRIDVRMEGFPRGSLFGPRGGCTARNAYRVCALILPLEGAKLTARDADTSDRWIQYVLE